MNLIVIYFKYQSPDRKKHITDDTNLSLVTMLAAMAGNLTLLHFRLCIYIQSYISVNVISYVLEEFTTVFLLVKF